MRLFDFFKKLVIDLEERINLFSKTTKTNSEYSELLVVGESLKQSKPSLVVSQYSKFPRYYTINGIKYDIDNPVDIQRLPLIKNAIVIDGKPYGMDTILYEHYRQCPDRSLGYVAYNKCQEFRKSGIVNKSEWEQEMDARYEERQKKEDLRKKQCDSFTIDDMQNFPDIPFGFHWVTNLFHTDGIAWFMLNMNNQQVALQYISKINDAIIDAREYVDGINDAEIKLNNINFSYPKQMHRNSMACTRVECYPYTASGKFSKYPVILHFETNPQLRDYGGFKAESIICGDIKILRDGNIGSASVNIWGNKFTFGLHGLSLVLKKVYNSYETKFNFSDMQE